MIMKTSRNDPFDLDTCIKGLSMMISTVHSDFYEFVYYFTFKKSFKEYYSEFNDPWDFPIGDGTFFDDVDDPFVQSGLNAFTFTGLAKFELDGWYSFVPYEDYDVTEEETRVYYEGQRFKPYQMHYKRSKSYKKLKLGYERSLAEFIHSLFLYSCALTAQSNKVPLVLKKQFNLTNDDAFRLLNKDDDKVVLLIDLMKRLRKILIDLRLNIYTPVIPVRKTTPKSNLDSKDADNSKK